MLLAKPEVCAERASMDNLTSLAQSVVDTMIIFLNFLHNTDPFGALMLFIFGLWRGWWVMGNTHKETTDRLEKVEEILDKLATGVQISSAVTMGVVQHAHLASPDAMQNDPSVRSQSPP